MKKLLFVVWLFIASVCSAQTLDIVVTGDSYARNEQAGFLSDLENIKAELFIRLWQRQSQINFIPISWNNKFQCRESSFWEGGTFNEGKVLAVVNGTGISWDAIHIISENLNGGSGGPISMSGARFHDRIHSGHVGTHEIGHTPFGLQHDGGFMNSSCNFGACGENATFTPAQFKTINETLNRLASVLPCEYPTITITSPATATGDYHARASMTGKVQQVEIILDGISKFTFMNWERNPNCSPAKGVSFSLTAPSKGIHTLTMIATDYNNQSDEQTINININ